MAGGGNGQAQESKNLIASQNSQSDRYGIAGDMFNSKEFLSALRTKDSGENSSVSRSFGNTIAQLEESQKELRSEIDMLKAKLAKSEERQGSGFGGIFGVPSKGKGPFGMF
jgi:hypothetical protein